MFWKFTQAIENSEGARLRARNDSNDEPQPPEVDKVFTSFDAFTIHIFLMEHCTLILYIAHNNIICRYLLCLLNM